MALTFCRDAPEPVGQQARFLALVAEYSMDIQYRAGRNHANCDALSRIRPCEIDGGEPCKQCHRKVIGKHAKRVENVRAVTTRSQKHAVTQNQTQQVENVKDTVVGQESRPQTTTPLSEPKRTRKKRARLKKAKKEGWLTKSAPDVERESVSMWDLAYIAEQQRADADIGPAMSWIDNGERPKWVSVKVASPALRALYQQYESLLIIEACYTVPIVM